MLLGKQRQIDQLRGIRVAKDAEQPTMFLRTALGQQSTAPRYHRPHLHLPNQTLAV
jgi:hypothetical protein